MSKKKIWFIIRHMAKGHSFAEASRLYQIHIVEQIKQLLRYLHEIDWDKETIDD